MIYYSLLLILLREAYLLFKMIVHLVLLIEWEGTAFGVPQALFCLDRWVVWDDYGTNLGDGETKQFVAPEG